MGFTLFHRVICQQLTSKVNSEHWYKLTPHKTPLKLVKIIPNITIPIPFLGISGIKIPTKFLVLHGIPGIP